MLKESDRYHTNSHQDPFSELVIYDNAAMPWSIDGLLDPSLFRYGKAVLTAILSCSASIQTAVARTQYAGGKREVSTALE
jgi:hypothetical protein